MQEVFASLSLSSLFIVFSCERIKLSLSSQLLEELSIITIPNNLISFKNLDPTDLFYERFLFISSRELKHFVLLFKNSNYLEALLDGNMYSSYITKIIFIFEMEAIFVHCRVYINLLNILIMTVDKNLPYICSRFDHQNMRPFNE